MNKIRIEYCTSWGYVGRAVALTRKLLNEHKNDIEEIALAKSGGGKVVEFELDWDDGRPEYEIEIKKDGLEYELEIHGYTGKILEFEIDD